MLMSRKKVRLWFSLSLQGCNFISKRSQSMNEPLSQCHKITTIAWVNGYHFKDSYVQFDILERSRVQRRNGLGLNGTTLRGVRMTGKGTSNVSCCHERYL